MTTISLVEDDMQQDKDQKQIDPSLSFHLMKFAFQDFQKSARDLTKHEYSLAYQHANEEMLLHQVILTSDDACCVVIPEITLKQTLQGVIDEYPSADAFHNTLKENNMGLEEYTLALHNDLRVETVLSRVATTVRAVTAAEVLSYYSRNREEFCRPERRVCGHIRIPFDPVSALDIDMAYAGISTIHEKLFQHPERFYKEKNLHTNTKLSGCSYVLRTFAAGELCPDLDRILFSLQPKEVSDIIETAESFDILYCKEILPPQALSLKESSAAIFSILLKKKQLEACRSWLQDLVQPTPEAEP